MFQVYIFALRMKMYNYIALLLLMTFVVKIMMVDGQWMVSAIAGEEYVHVNPFCKSKNGSGAPDQSGFHKIADKNNITLQGICSSQLYLNETVKHTTMIPTLFKMRPYRVLPSYVVHQDTHYPPPQV